MSEATRDEIYAEGKLTEYGAFRQLDYLFEEKPTVDERILFYDVICALGWSAERGLKFNFGIESGQSDAIKKLRDLLSESPCQVLKLRCVGKIKLERARKVLGITPQSTREEKSRKAFSEWCASTGRPPSKQSLAAWEAALKWQRLNQNQPNGETQFLKNKLPDNFYLTENPFRPNLQP